MKTSEIQRLRNLAAKFAVEGDLSYALAAVIDEYLEARRVLREEHEAGNAYMRDDPRDSYETRCVKGDRSVSATIARIKLTERIAAEDAATDAGEPPAPEPPPPDVADLIESLRSSLARRSPKGAR